MQKGTGSQLWGPGSVIRGSGSQIRGAGSEIRRDPPHNLTSGLWSLGRATWRPRGCSSAWWSSAGRTQHGTPHNRQLSMILREDCRRPSEILRPAATDRVAWDAWAASGRVVGSHTGGTSAGDACDATDAASASLAHCCPPSEPTNNTHTHTHPFNGPLWVAR